MRDSNFEFDPETGRPFTIEERAKHNLMRFSSERMMRGADGKWTEEKQMEFLSRIFHAMPKGEELLKRLNVDRAQFGSWSDVDLALIEWAEESEQVIREPVVKWKQHLQNRTRKQQARNDELDSNGSGFVE